MNKEEREALVFDSDGKVKDEFLVSNFEFWVSQTGEPGVTFKPTGESFYVDSEEFKSFLRDELYSHSLMGIDENTFRYSFAKVRRRAAKGSKSYIFSRIGWEEGFCEIRFASYYIQISHLSATKTLFPKFKFVLTDGMISYPDPDLEFYGDPTDLLRPYFCFEDMELGLLVAWLFSCLYPISKPILVIDTSAGDYADAISCVRHIKTLLDPRADYIFEFPTNSKVFKDDVLAFWIAGNWTQKKMCMVEEFAKSKPIAICANKDKLDDRTKRAALILDISKPIVYQSLLPQHVICKFWGWAIKAIRQGILNTEEPPEHLSPWLKVCHNAYPVFPIDGPSLAGFSSAEITEEAIKIGKKFAELVALNEEKTFNILDLKDEIDPVADPREFGKILRRNQKALQVLGFSLEFSRTSLARRVTICRKPTKVLAPGFCVSKGRDQDAVEE